MSTYSELKSIVESLGINCSSLAQPQTGATYAIVRMLTHQSEMNGDDKPVIFGAYMQIDLFTTADADTKARSILNAALAAGYLYRGRSDDYLNDRQHIEIRLLKLEGNNP